MVKEGEQNYPCPQQPEDAPVSPVNELAIHEKLKIFLNSIEQQDMQRIKEGLESIHRELKACPCARVYELYIQRRMPTLDLFDIAFTRLADNLESFVKNEWGSLEKAKNDESGGEIIKLLTLFKGRPDAIRKSVAMYVNSIITLYRVAERQRKYATMSNPILLQEKDKYRRDRHNSLMETLRISAELVESLKQHLDEHELKKILPGYIVYWDTDTPVHQKEPYKDGDLVLFSERLLANDRDIIRDWALSADFHRILSQIREKFKLDYNNS